ncbi:MAG TPA: hypothetical protein DIT13_00555 [Verrucomicrobiales bacterium]|nr:hypothetical protein [Verrucomicrobiales bacterium]HRJ07261.1 BatA domain-containing protein [Prosthecobacter sp.]HRK13251.1 BatA domain-containing protein [Prosthecobacter sp.]
MSWLFPLYLLGAGAIIAPILMHLRRRPPQDRVEFSSLMFLQARTPVPVSKRRIEHWLLLLLRCLALILLALMFSRPWLQTDARAGADGGRAVFMLVDRSASMRRGDLMKQALGRAREVIQKTTPADRMALAAFDDRLHPLWTFGEDAESGPARSGALLQKLGEIQPGWQATDLGRALVDALAQISSASGIGGMERVIVVLTDFQEGARLDALRGIAWPEETRVQALRVETRDEGNMTLSLAAADTGNVEDRSAKTGEAETLRVRLSNSRDSRVSDFTLRWEKSRGEAMTGYLPAGAARILSVPLPTQAAASADTLLLSGDSWDFDNRIFLAPARPRQVGVAWLGAKAAADEAASPLFYLKRALQPTTSLEPQVADAAELPRCQMAVLQGAPPEGFAEWIRAGGLAVWLLEPGTSAQDVESLAGVNGVALKEAPVDNYRMLGEVKAEHPLLRPFADPRLRDFTKLRFWKHRQADLTGTAAEKIEIIARFDNGAPALMALQMEKGTLLMLASGWHPADSQLALSTKFVPLIFGWLEAAGFSHAAQSGMLVGAALPVTAGDALVLTPEGRETTVKAGMPYVTESVGIYQVKTGAETRLHAVNLPPEEGRVTAMDAERLKDFGIRLHEMSGTQGEIAQNERVQERLAAGEAEKQQRAWLWFLAALLAVLGAETLLAWRAGRGRVEEAAPAPQPAL